MPSENLARLSKVVSLPSYLLQYLDWDFQATVQAGFPFPINEFLRFPRVINAIGYTRRVVVVHVHEEPGMDLSRWLER